MNKLNHKARVMIEPSTRDSISSWLDVLTGMLVMPDTQRQQVRDELEDHLRSRVDDLLILGKSEPEAIRIAVAELGETAELAKLITHAHTQSNPRRKLMNTALIAVALAGMFFGGFNIINGTGAPSATPSNGGAVPVVVPADMRRDDGKKHTFNLEEVPDIQAVEAIAEAFGLEVTVSEGLKAYYRNAGFPYTFTLQGEYTLEQAVKALEWADVNKMQSRVVRVNDRELQLMTTDEFVRQQVLTRVYPIPEWLYTAKEKADYPSSLERLLGVKYDLGYTSIELVGDSIIVAAPPAIHNEIVDYEVNLEYVLQSQHEKSLERTRRRDDERRLREEERANERRELAEQRRQERERTIDQIQQEFDRVRDSLIQSQVEVDQLNGKIAELGKTFRGVHQDAPEQRTQQLKELKIRRVDAELRLEEYQSRYNYLRDTLIESEYAALFEGLE